MSTPALLPPPPPPQKRLPLTRRVVCTVLSTSSWKPNERQRLRQPPHGLLFLPPPPSLRYTHWVTLTPHHLISSAGGVVNESHSSSTCVDTDVVRCRPMGFTASLCVVCVCRRRKRRIKQCLFWRCLGKSYESKWHTVQFICGCRSPHTAHYTGHVAHWSPCWLCCDCLAGNRRREKSGRG